MARLTEARAEPQASQSSEWRSMRSGVSWALLGLVIERGGYGYELLKRFEREYAEALPIKSDWHIYRALDGLRARGLIEEVPEKAGGQPDGGRQPKPHYRSTDEGVRRYAEWLVAHFGPPRRQSRLFVRQLAVLAGRPAIALEIIGRYERACLDECDIGSRGDNNDAHSVSDLGLVERLAEEERRSFLAWVLPWLQYARAQLEDEVEHGC